MGTNGLPVCSVAMDAADFAKLKEPIALVVDDEPLLLMDTADIVSEAGYHVIEARTADEAFAFLQKHPSLRLLFTDVQTPGTLNGIELAQYVGEHWPHICIIVASGAVTPEAGALPENSRFLSKPLNQALVLETLNEICG